MIKKIKRIKNRFKANIEIQKCYEIVGKKFPMYKIKQKKAAKYKIELKTILLSRVIYTNAEMH